MSFKDCIAVVQKAVGKKLSDDQLDDIFTLLDRRAARKMRDDASLSKDGALAQAAQELADEKKLAALIEKRSRAINVARKIERFGFYDTSGFKSKADAVNALNVGKEGPFAGAGNSVDAQGHALESMLIGPMVAELEKGGVLKIAARMDATTELKVVNEISRLNGAKNLTPASEPHVKEIARIFQKYTEAGRIMQNEAGGWIGKIDGYVTRQSHDPVLIYGKGGGEADFVKWRDAIVKELDDRTFIDVESPEAFLRETYDALASGVHLKAGQSDWLGGFKGPGSLAKRVSQERVLQFKDAESWWRYHQQFGQGTLSDAVFAGLQRAAKNTAVMKVWGTNPEAAFRADVDQLLKNADATERKALRSKITKRNFQAISGVGDIPGDPKWAHWGATARIGVSMAKLGGVVLSSLPDLAARAAVLRHNGIGLAEAWTRSVEGFMTGRTAPEQKAVADELGAGVDGVVGSITARFAANDSVPGAMSKLAKTFFKWNLLSAWTDGIARGTGLILARNMANLAVANRSFDSLHPLHQTTLKRYGINADTWNLLKSMPVKSADGEHFMMTDAVRDLPDSEIRSWLKKPDASDKEVARAKLQIETNLRAYYVNQVREAITAPGAGERIFTTWGGAAGTMGGEVVRALMQFKTFPVTFIRKHLNREFNRSGDGVDKAGLAHLMVATTILGGISMSLKDLAKGRDPTAPFRNADGVMDWAEIMGRAMQQGGGLGIYGDFLFGDFNRFGGGFAETLAGPLVGTVGEWVRVLSVAKDGQGDNQTMKEYGRKVGQGALKATVDSMPFANLFYTRMAMDYLFLFSAQEALNPGFMRRHEKLLKQNSGQTFILPPSQTALRPFG